MPRSRLIATVTSGLAARSSNSMSSDRTKVADASEPLSEEPSSVEHGSHFDDSVNTSDLNDSKLSRSSTYSRSRPGPRPRVSKEGLEIRNRIFIGGLKKSINEDDLRGLFETYGEIKECQIKERGNGSVRGWAFITYGCDKQAAEALREGANESLSLRGERLNVQKAFRRIPAPDKAGVQTGAVVPNFQGIPMPNNFMGPNMASGNAMGYPLMPFYQYSPYGYATSAMPYYPSPFIPQYGGPEILQSRYMNMYGMLNGMWPGPAAVPGMPPVVTVQSPSPNGAPSSPTTSSNIGRISTSSSEPFDRPGSAGGRPSVSPEFDSHPYFPGRGANLNGVPNYHFCY